jgi:tRNA G46 methylase TrmB
MPHVPPKTIQSPQSGPYPKLERVVEKHITTHYRRPYREHNLVVFEQLKKLVALRRQPGLILDSCCGTGLSTQRLAQANPDSLVIGIDQSASRLDRESEEFSARADNSVLFQANCEDIWRLCVNADIQFDQHFILYPNPYPKPEHFKRRWHGHPCFPYLAKLSARLELRSNWALYLDEFALAWKLLTNKGFERQVLTVEKPLTLFEKKYFASGQRVYALTLSS